MTESFFFPQIFLLTFTAKLFSMGEIDDSQLIVKTSRQSKLWQNFYFEHFSVRIILNFFFFFSFFSSSVLVKEKQLLPDASLACRSGSLARQAFFLFSGKRFRANAPFEISETFSCVRIDTKPNRRKT